MPLVFTEQGVAMLSSVLNSEKAIEVNIQIIRILRHRDWSDILFKKDVGQRDVRLRTKKVLHL